MLGNSHGRLTTLGSKSKGDSKTVSNETTEEDVSERVTKTRRKRQAKMEAKTYLGQEFGSSPGLFLDIFGVCGSFVGV